MPPDKKQARAFALWGSFRETGRFYFETPCGVSLERFKANPWEYQTGYSAKGSDDHHLETNDPTLIESFKDTD